MAFATIVDGMTAGQRQEFLEDLSGVENWEEQADRLYAELEARGHGRG